MSNDPRNPYGPTPVAPPPLAPPPAPGPAGSWGAPPPGPAPGAGAGWPSGGGDPMGGLGGPPPAGGGPGDAWGAAPPPGSTAAAPRKTGCLAAALALLFLAAGGAAVLLFLNSSGLLGGPDMTLVGLSLEQPTGHTAYVVLTWQVDTLPPEDDAGGAGPAIRLESDALTDGVLEYDWFYLASKDDAEASVPSKRPPIGVPMSIRILIERDLVEQVTIYDDQSVDLTATLLWNGHRRDRRTIDISHLYSEKQ